MSASNINEKHVLDRNKMFAVHCLIQQIVSNTRKELDGTRADIIGEKRKVKDVLSLILNRPPSKDEIQLVMQSCWSQNGHSY